MAKKMLIVGMAHPAILPSFCRLPDFVNGIPICLDILFFTPEIPNALFHENENPYFLPIASSSIAISIKIMWIGW